jgi:4-amino-4-deoxy-L-arabinose transferase-like glycosyltransferase
MPEFASTPAYRRKELVVLFLILTLTFSLRLAFLHEPLERDEGLYAYIGQEILRGAMPYRDAMDQKPPGIHYIYAAIIALFGATPEAIRVFTACYALLTIALVYLSARRLFGVRAGLFAALGYGVFSSGPLLRGESSNSEVFMVLPVLASFHLFVVWMDTRRRALLPASGLCAALAMLIKTVALPHLLVALPFLAWRRIGDRSARERTLDAALFLLPAVVLALATVAYFRWRGAFDDLYYWTVTFNRMYGRTTLARFFSGMKMGLGRVLPELLPLLLLAIPALFRVLFRERSSRNLFAVAFIPAAYLGLSMPTKFFEHYFIQLLPPLAIMAGYGAALVSERRGKLLALVLPLVAASVFYWGTKEYRFFFLYTPEEVSAKKYGSDVFVRAAEVARYVRERTAPSDYVFQWGFEPEIYFLSDRRAPNPYTVHFAVEDSRAPSEAVNDLVASIIRTKPVYIIVQQGRSGYLGFAELEQILSAFYTREKECGGMEIWRIRVR